MMENSVNGSRYRIRTIWVSRFPGKIFQEITTAITRHETRTHSPDDSFMSYLLAR